MPRRLSFAALTALTITGLVAATSTARSTGGSPVVSTLAPSTFSIDETHSQSLFRVRHLGASNFYGRFNGVTGSIQYDTEGGVPSFDVSIAVGSVDTGNDNLDNHLKSPDFFNAREYPDMTFKSRSSTKRPDGAFDVTGDLSIHGVTKDITARVEFVGAVELSPQSGFRCGFETEFTIDRTEFGMDYGVAKGMLGKDIKIIVSLEGKRDS